MFLQAQVINPFLLVLKKRFQGFQLYFINSVIRELLFLQTGKQHPDTMFSFLTEIFQAKRVSMTPNINKNY